ncbi:MAG: SOS response-associated peptidase [Rhodospirillaceae bacterium]|nr:SOS response-associated peptidase [Rhodospirillaceae bacterium]
MCGRFSITDPDEAMRDLFGYKGPLLDFAPRFNVAPTQSVPVVRLNESGKRAMATLRWGLVPSWAKELGIGAKMINARAETVAEKPAFRAAFKSRRCLVPANGFYEWKAEGGKKQPYRVILGKPAHPLPFAFAGLWERWRDPAAAKDAPPIDTFTIVTTDAAPAIAHIHDRMPVMLRRREHLEAWLDSAGRPAEAVKDLLAPYAGDDLFAYPVSAKVNNARYDGPDCVAPA